MKEEDAASKERLETLRKEIATTREKLDGMKANWQNEKGAIDQVQDLKRQIDDAKTEEERATRAATSPAPPSCASRPSRTCRGAMTRPRPHSMPSRRRAACSRRRSRARRSPRS